jgi:hypothetical protein
MKMSLAKFFVLIVPMLGALAIPNASAQGHGPKTQRARLPSLKADKADYAPGTLAILSGGGFYPNEIVRMRVTHADGLPSTGAEHLPWTIAANNNGRFVTSWHVCEDDCVGATLLATADGMTSGGHAETSFTDNHDCGTGVVVSVTPVGGSCSAFTPAVGSGPDTYEVQQGGTYTITIEDVSECTGDTITVFIQSGDTGNFCFNAIGGSGTYSGTFTMPSPACNTMPVSYKCGADAACTHPGSLAAQGSTSACGGVHLRASNFDGNCIKTSTDTDCGTPPPQGACCLVDGTCVEATQVDCVDMGGTYNGDGSLCVDASCPPAAGACCLADGSCVQVSEEDCTAQGGTYNGDFSLCMDANCTQPDGACCLTDGSCVEVTEEECTVLGGTFGGDFSLCANANCAQSTGACCLEDGSCVQVTEEECNAIPGLYNGDGSLCESVTCEGGNPVCFVLDFDTDDDGNGMVHGTKVDAEFDCNGANYAVAITGSVNSSGSNSAAILNSSTGPAAQDPDLLVGKGNILILQTDANLTQCPANSGVYCSHNDDENGGTLSFAFCAPVIPSSIVLIDIDGTDGASSVVLTDVNGKTRTYTVPGNWTGDKVTNFPELGWKVLSLTTLANQPGFGSTATASDQAGYDPSSVVQLVVHLGGSGGIDDLSWCE